MVDTRPMSMNIKSAEAHELARELAALEDITVTEAVTRSLREALAVRRAEAEAQARYDGALSIANRIHQQLQENPGPSLWDIADELWDERGMPK